MSALDALTFDASMRAALYNAVMHSRSILLRPLATPIVSQSNRNPENGNRR